jgi:hypothetical protein
MCLSYQKSLPMPGTTIYDNRPNLFMFFRMIQLFLSLVMMDTTQQDNASITNQIFAEAMDYRLYRAFLVDAPQSILELVIILKIGKIGLF